MTTCGVTAAGDGVWRLKLANASLERWLEVISNFAVSVGVGAGEAGRLDGLKNEGVLMACIVQGLEERAVGRYVVVGRRELEMEWCMDGFCVYGKGRLGHPQRRTDEKLSHETVNRDPG